MTSRDLTPSTRASILVVEDDHALREALLDTLQLAGFDGMAARNGMEALSLMSQFGFKLVLSDLHMPKLDGLRLVPKILAKKPFLPIILMTAYGSVEKAVEAIKLGATDFITKPFDAEDLVEKIRQYVQPNSTSADLTPPDSLEMAWSTETQSPIMKKLYRFANKVAASDVSVLITGASGTGKEGLSRYIHAHSRRCNAPFVAINCAAIPENMLEAMLFGYEKGAFTGALSASPGKFEQANGGALLLDEITEMPVMLQAKLLRVLQEREVERLGGKKTIALDVRVIATSNRCLRDAVAQGRFREDLFYRLNVFPLEMPSLKARREDLISLARFLLRKHSIGDAPGLSPEACERLLAYDWPGNIRELENVIQRAIVLAEGGEISPEALMIDSVDVGISHPLETPSKASLSAEAETGAAVSGEDRPSTEGALEDGLRQQENHLIIEALRCTAGNRKAAAERLGISTRTLRYKLARIRASGLNINDLLEA
ncbi:MAG: sigma-54 dependent transcriptional regulator [Gammaproteobacteria bacterium]